MISFLKHIKFITSILFCILFISAKAANVDHCKFFEVRYKDSLVAKNETNILYNTIKINNPNRKFIRLGITVKIPSGWKLLSKDSLLSGREIFCALQPNSTKSIPLNLLRLPKTKACWDSIKIFVRVPDVTDRHIYYCHLKPEADPKFIAEYITEDLLFYERPDSVQLSFHLKNTGNIDDTYTLQWQNQNMLLNDKNVIKLDPGRDTIYNWALKLSASQWQKLCHENIALCIKGSGMNSYTHLYKLSRPRHNIKENSSPYAQIPLTIEGGMINQNNRLNYYGAARGDIHFGNRNDLRFYYKSKQFGTEVYGIQQNMYLVDYIYHDWKLSAGTIQPIQRYFLSNGRGFGISHNFNNNLEVAVTANLRDRNFYYSSNNFSTQVRYQLGKIGCTNTISSNFDDQNHLNGYVLSGTAQLLNTQKAVLSVQAGTGLSQKTRDIEGVKKQTWGFTGGYKFSFRQDNNWTINSSVEYYDKNFPGINNGMTVQMHQVAREFNKKFAGLFYSSSYLNTRYYTDTLYNTDILKYNSERYGVNAGLKDTRNSLMISTGLLNEGGIGSQTDLDNMVFFDVNYSYQKDKKISVLLNSQNAFKNNVGSNNASVFVTSTMASVNVGWPGIMATYTRKPVLGYDGPSQNVKSYDVTLCGGPFMKFNFFKSRLSGMVKFQVSKSVYDQIVRSAVVGSVNYLNDKIGTSIQLAGNIPTSNILTNGHQLPVTEEKFLTLSISKQLNVPVITKRKLYTMTLVLFNDHNNNGLLDAKEELLKDVQILVNGNQILLTDKKGEARYVNITKGNYAIEFNTIQSKGLVPVNGILQSVSLEKNTTITIPYKKGTIVSGKIKIIKDAYSKTKFTADGIKVIAVDTSGKTYSTVADIEGDYSFSLPAGIYTISLNPQAFEGSDFIPDKLSYKVDLFKNNEDKTGFTITQKPRKVEFLNRIK
ncbi:MAG: hypothetical protein BGO70_16060 [Bacteroidetes bacterium 43-93]|nr:hypothetical protein [Bacteroidota bacterium]OJX01282.1 MAG: hypothetical protein BGO70_16060 [Bacteroidetes bacterium 43-93]